MKTIITREVESATEELKFRGWVDGVLYLETDADIGKLALACGVEGVAVRTWILNFNALREAVRFDLEDLHRRVEKLEKRYG